MMKILKAIVIFIVVLTVGAIAAQKLLKEKQKVEDQKTPLSLTYSIKTAHTKEATVEQKRPFLAKVESIKQINISTKLSGAVKKVFVSESQVVKKGELLVNIDDKVLKTNLKTLLQNLKIQKKDVQYYKSVQKRNKKLFEANAISKEKYDASVLLVLNKEALRDSTKDKINALKSDLTYLQIRSPFDGVVSSVYLHEGDLATAGKPILMLNSIAKKIEFSYATTKDSIKIGDEVYAKDEKIGYVSKIYPNAKNNLNIAEVKLTSVLDVPNDSYISIDVITKSMRGCSVLNESLLHNENDIFVLAFKDKKFEKVKVEVLIENEQRAIIAPCVSEKVAVASESKLAILPFYKNLTLVSSDDE